MPVLGYGALFGFLPQLVEPISVRRARARLQTAQHFQLRALPLRRTGHCSRPSPVATGSSKQRRPDPANRRSPPPSTTPTCPQTRRPSASDSHPAPSRMPRSLQVQVHDRPTAACVRGARRRIGALWSDTPPRPVAAPTPARRYRPRPAAAHHDRGPGHPGPHNGWEPIVLQPGQRHEQDRRIPLPCRMLTYHPDQATPGQHRRPRHPRPLRPGTTSSLRDRRRDRHRDAEQTLARMRHQRDLPTRFDRNPYRSGHRPLGEPRIADDSYTIQR